MSVSWPASSLAQDGVLPLLPSNLHWHSPWALALLIVPLVLLLWNPAARRSAALPLPMVPGGVRVPKTLRQRLLWVPRVLSLIAAAALIVALARPQLGYGRTQTTTDAIAIQIVVDRSGSMGTRMDLDGVALSRLDVVKRVLRDFLLGNDRDLPGRPSDLVGLVSFARFAETNCPLVRDHTALVQLADALRPAQDQIEGGTAIGDGLALAAARLRNAEQDLKSRKGAGAADDIEIKSKIIVLLTDGDNNAGETLPEEAAKLAKDWGIRIYAIGIGGGGFTTMRTPFGEQQIPVASEIDENRLRPLAETTGGIYRRAKDADSLRKIYAEIDKLETSTVKSIDFTDFNEVFTYPAAAGIAALALSSLLSSLWLRRTPA